jgi:hypothetical protein
VIAWTFRAIAVLLVVVSAFGFLNAFYLRFHGPGADLGVIAAVLALAAWAGARRARKTEENDS